MLKYTFRGGVMKKIKPVYFYISYFIFNILNSYILMHAVFHPNISRYTFTIPDFLSSLLGNLGITLLIYGISCILFTKTKSKVNFLIAFSFILTVLCLGMAIYANIFSTFFRFSQLSSFNNPSQGTFFLFYAKYALSMIADFSQGVHLIPFICLIILSLFVNTEYQRYHTPIYKLSLVVFSMLFIILPIVNLDKKIKNTIYESSLNAFYGSNVIGIYDFYFYDYFNYLTKKEYKPTNEDIKNINTFLEYYEEDSYISPIDNNTYTVSNNYTSIAKDKNLIMIQLEAINNFVIDLKVDGIEITPNLNKLAKSGLYYDNFYSSAGIGNTSDAEFSALTGLYGNGNDLTIFDFSGKNYETLAKDFKKEGYTTFSSHGNVGHFYYRDVEHLNTLGFDRHFDLKYYQSLDKDAPLIHSYLDDVYFLENFVKLLPDENFFAYAIMVTSHSPYVPTKEIPANNFNSLTNLASSYLDFCMYIDKAVGNFISKLKEANKLEDTLLVFFGDHTSSLFKKDIESITKVNYKDYELRQILQSVPLIIYNEGLFSSRVNHKVAATTDLYRSLSNLYGLDNKYHLGVDIFSTEPGYVYSPRNLDIILDDSVILYPSKNIFGNIEINKNKYINIFENYKYHNDLILKSRFFK